MTKFVLSTMTNSVSYNTYKFIGDVNSKQGVLPVPVEKIIIQGGAHLPSFRSGFGEMSRDKEGQPIWVAEGVVTPVSDEKYEILKDHWLFKKHLDGGYVKVLTTDISGNHKAVVKEIRTMTKEDGFAQLTPSTVQTRVGASQAKIKELGQTEFRI